MKTFTFGSDHVHPVTGKSLWLHYVQVPGNWIQSRQIMNAIFGRNWSMQYDTPEAAGSSKYSLIELEWSVGLVLLLKVNLPQTGMFDDDLAEVIRAEWEELPDA